MARKQTKPWKRPRPKSTRRTTLTAASKKSARRRARKSGRRYPNLVDNMRAAKRQRTRRHAVYRRTKRQRSR